VLFTQHFSVIEGGSLLDGYDVVVCEECGFGFAYNIPGQDAFDAYYRDLSKYEYEEKGGLESEFDFSRFEEISRTITSFLSDKRARILEIGCATGGLLSLLKKAGFENILGIDPSPACSRTAERLYGIRVLTNSLSHVEIPEGSIDFIVMVGVLEHVRDLENTLRKLWRTLSSDGHIYILVPDASRYKEGEDAPFQEFSVEHINFFSPISLKNLLQRSGFTEVLMRQDIFQVNPRTTTPVIQSIFRRLRGPDQAQMVHDSVTEEGLVKYIDQSRRIDKSVRDLIDKMVSRDQPILVWGTGAHTLRLLATSRLAEARIEAFVDSNPKYQGKKLNGIPIIGPAQVQDSTLPILISSRVYQDEIEDLIRHRLGLANEIVKLYTGEQ
jgi:SAM-dependent methyltransferase